jgi:hypothetical protein
MIRNLHLAPWLLALGIAPIVAACTVYSTTPAVVAEGEIVESPPPAPAYPPPEPIPPPPSAVHIWIEGHYRWGGRAYVWERGHYEARPHPRAHYVRGHWQARGRARVWINGHWD